MATATFSRSIVAPRPGHQARRQVRRITGSGVDARPARARDLGHLARALQTVARDRGQQVDALLAPLDIVATYVSRENETARSGERESAEEDTRLTLAASPISVALSADRLAVAFQAATLVRDGHWSKAATSVSALTQ